LFGQHVTNFDGEKEAINTALRQLLSRTAAFKMAVIFSDSTTAILSTAKFYALLSKKINRNPFIH
jgi:hypothetical protein